MLWRMIGPFRGGRTVAAVGVPSQPNVFYIGVNNGGVWKTTDAGRVWTPIFDDQPTGSIGAIFFASNTLWKTTSGGSVWTEISPDLSRKEWTLPPNVGKYSGMPAAQPKQRGVIYALAPSPLEVNRIWAGTDDGLIHLTTDGGGTWKDVTPSALAAWAKVSVLEASHFGADTAYAAINTFRLDDLRPHIYRTRDGGTTWTRITRGIPDGGIVNVVREDPKTKGLLVAGTEREVYVSFDDGEQWQSPRLNMPATSIRDLVIHEDDVVVGTHGRGFWILDDIEPLRRLLAILQNADAAPTSQVVAAVEAATK